MKKASLILFATPGTKQQRTERSIQRTKPTVRRVTVDTVNSINKYKSVTEGAGSKSDELSSLQSQAELSLQQAADAEKKHNKEQQQHAAEHIQRMIEFMEELKRIHQQSAINKSISIGS